MERMSPEPGDYKKTGAAEKGSTGIIFVPGLSFVGHRSWVIVRGSLGKAAQALCRIGGDFFQQEPEILQGLSDCGWVGFGKTAQSLSPPEFLPIDSGLAHPIM